jgi:hypothetical protein
MSLCTLCGHPAFGADALCAYHSSCEGDDWATGNRIMCDFLHRGIVPAGPLVRAGRTLELLRQSEAYGGTPALRPAPVAAVDSPSIHETVLRAVVSRPR